MRTSLPTTCPFTRIVTDVDGVFTDGSFLYTPEGKSHKKFGAHDSDGLKILRTLGIGLSAISADRRGFEITKQRMDDMQLSVDLVSEKERYEYIETYFSLDRTCFVGDGIHDAGLLKNCAFSFSPSSAPAFVKQYADVVTCPGGHGVFLDIALFVMEAWFPNKYEEFLINQKLK